MDTDTEMDVDELSAGLSKLLIKGERRVLNGLARVQIDSSWSWNRRPGEINSVRCCSAEAVTVSAAAACLGG
jgi:hypothetical protein